MGNFSGDAKPPGYYVKQRLLRNKPALFGLSTIMISIFISICGYLIMPDQTPDANDGAVQIQKQLPGFTATFLKIRKNRAIEQKNLFQKALHGQESAYMIVPIVGYEIDDLIIQAQIFGKKDFFREYNLLDAVRAKNSRDISIEYTSAGETVVMYEDPDGVKMSVTRDELIEEFERTNIERRTYLREQIKWVGIY